ncbi:MAG: heavy metal translocating P-type ATPase [Gammaproteobacteria bacterium]|nr:MAG: heavy metal translocating P-type ATPase [Gammaproteobacteria bacterium]
MLPVNRENGCKLVHETPVRLRFKLRLLRDQGIDFSWLQVKLDSLNGVDRVRINPAAMSVIFDYNGEAAAKERIVNCVSQLSVDDIPQGGSEVDELPELAPMLVSSGLIVSMPFLGESQRQILTYLNIFPTLLAGVKTFFSEGIKMEVLDAIAVGLTAYKGGYLAANITSFLMRLGSYLETATEQQSNRLLKQLLRPQVPSAWVERDGVLVEVPGEQVRHGEFVEVGVGEKLPVDGLIVDGAALVNQSSITGEDLPVRKEVMDRAIAGTVIEEGRLRVEARFVGDETTTARIAQFMSRSLEDKSKSVRLAQQQADQRVYLTLGTGALIYLLTGDTRRLESIFLVDYSCALKLGTPVAFKSGMYNGARNGILFKGGNAIEQLADVDCVVFDKTGTLTYSQLMVTDVEVLDPGLWTRDRLLAVTASIEEHASHPIAEAIVRKAKEESLNHIDHGEVEYIVAHGMNCPVNDDVLVIGSRHYLEEHEGISFADYEELIVKMESEGKTLLYVGTSNKTVGIIGLLTQVRTEASSVVSRLHAMGIEQIALLTGDRQPKAEAMAAELGIDSVFAEQVPEEKADVIRQLQEQGYRVAYVGDGVNDGPALVNADVGISMASGSELARASADVVLLEDHLSSLTDALFLAQQSMALIKTNYQLAVGINTLVLLGAAGGVLSPVLTTLLHNGTTVGVLLRALNGAKLD